MPDNTITEPEQVDALPAGQWVVDADGDKLCLMDTHMGFPQRMWGRKNDGKTKGEFTSYHALDRATFPLQLAEIAPGVTCPHAKANECGQCVYCGKPAVAERRPLELMPFATLEIADEEFVQSPCDDCGTPVSHLLDEDPPARCGACEELARRAALVEAIEATRKDTTA